MDSTNSTVFHTSSSVSSLSSSASTATMPTFQPPLDRNPSTASAPLPSPANFHDHPHFASFPPGPAAQQTFYPQQQQQQQVNGAGSQQSYFPQQPSYFTQPQANQMQAAAHWQQQQQAQPQQYQQQGPQGSVMPQPETAPFLRDFTLVAEAAKRAQVACLMRDMEGIEL
ncbi:MAG: hypothetical protein M1821_007188 [Bathelium mastoideum]|nr:MAG: hypothetical protein M1821_007188 [Bathelium mastoideum]